MKILIVSDTHGVNYFFDAVYNRVKPVDLVIHLGDAAGGVTHIEQLVESELKMVAGNNDYSSSLPDDDIIQIGKHKAFITHGHRYGVYFSNELIKEEAKRRGADIVMYGHTHVPLIDMSCDDIWAVNPGSISMPRQEGHKPSYIIMDIDKSETAHLTINYIE